MTLPAVAHAPCAFNFSQASRQHNIYHSCSFLLIHIQQYATRLTTPSCFLSNNSWRKVLSSSFLHQNITLFRTSFRFLIHHFYLERWLPKVTTTVFQKITSLVPQWIRFLVTTNACLILIPSTMTIHLHHLPKMECTSSSFPTIPHSTSAYSFSASSLARLEYSSLPGAAIPSCL